MASSSAVQPLKVVTARARAERIPFGCPRRTGQVGFFFFKRSPAPLLINERDQVTYTLVLAELRTHMPT
jgi:hypothetical protein